MKRCSDSLFPADLAPGMKIRLVELQSINSREAWKKVTAEEKKMMVRALEEQRKAKVSGVRTRGLAEINDVRHTLARMDHEVSGMHSVEY
jgi:hypothetical protein